MSKIALTPNNSGTGTFTIAAPGTNTDRTLTLPDASGTVNTSGSANEVPAGSAGAPAIYPTGDSNTGIFFPAADTIAFAEGGVEGMRIDSAGRVTMPYQPAFLAYGAPATLVNNSTIIWTSTSLNRGSVYNTANGRFTVPTAGLYQFFASVRIEDSSPVATFHRVGFQVNGAIITWSQSRLNSRTAVGYYTHASSDQLIGLNAGDYVTVRFESNVASFTTAAQNEHVFYGYLIG
jgi:hypothetical protein